MVVLIDCAAHGAQRVVAVGHGVRQRELCQAAGACCLDDADVCYVVRHHRVEADAHLLSLAAFNVVRAEDAVCNGVFATFVGIDALVFVADFGSVKEIDSMINEFNHNVNVFGIK